MFRNRTPVALLLSVIAFIVFYGMGCGEFNSPVGNDSAVTVTPTLPSLDGLAVLYREAGGEPVLAGGGHGDDNENGNGHGGGGGNSNFASEQIDSHGGHVKLDDIKVDVPKDAVSAGETITVSISLPDPSVFVWELQPHDYTFGEKATIKIDLNNADLTGVNPTDIAFYTWDEGTGTWVEEGGHYNDNHIWIDVDHFSYWALASD